jgi:predicted GNAT family acetyltransferase
MTPTDLAITDNRQASRFEARVNGQLAVAEYRRQGDAIVFTHTEVPEALEGRGIGSALARAALDAARAEGARVVPACPFMADYIESHPEYADLVTD